MEGPGGAGGPSCLTVKVGSPRRTRGSKAEGWGISPPPHPMRNWPSIGDCALTQAKYDAYRDTMGIPAALLTVISRMMAGAIHPSTTSPRLGPSG